VLAEVDLALRALFQARMTTLLDGTPPSVLDTQIGIAPPDDDWIGDVRSGTPRKALNIFLADLRENRRLRSTERVERVEQGVVVSEPAPMRVDAHYLITAWSPSEDRRTKTLDEHEVLAEAAGVLVEAQVLTVAGVELPTEILPPEGFPKLAELWGTMGEKHRWKPAILLVVTVPVARATDVDGTPVTTRLTEYTIDGAVESAELLIQIGGTVSDGLGNPVRRAWVQLEEDGGQALQATRSNADGQFDFLRVAPGAYRLRARADAHAELLSPPIGSPPMTVPSPTGRYDVAFP
jgi:uncharacterized protein DUF4255/carboxypeptidase family protein